MLKVILMIVAVLFAYWYFVARKRLAGKSRQNVAAAENMVACARCGLRVPESDAISAGGRNFCSDEHRRLGAA